MCIAIRCKFAFLVGFLIDKQKTNFIRTIKEIYNYVKYIIS